MTDEDSVEKLASHVARQAMSEKVPLAEKIDALKALTALYAAKAKNKPKGRPDDEAGDGRSFDSFREDIDGLRDEVHNRAQ